MASKKTAENETDSFRGFLRDLGVRAFDQLAVRSTGRRRGSADQPPSGALVRLATYWSGLNETEKHHFFDQMISAAQLLAAAAPVAIAVDQVRRRRKKRAEAQDLPPGGPASARPSTERKATTRGKSKA